MVTAAQGETEVEVSAEGLEPNTAYEVSLVATNQGGQNPAGPISFKTAGDAPEVQPLYAYPVASTSAGIGAQIRARNQATTYFFEWGETSAYGDVAPSTPEVLGSDNAPHVVTASLGNLVAATEYHYRVVATNDSGTTLGPDRQFTTLSPPTPEIACPNVAIRQEQSAQDTPDCRAWERVSPAAKESNSVYSREQSRHRRPQVVTASSMGSEGRPRGPRRESR